MSLELYHTILLIAGGVNLMIALALLMSNSDYRDYNVYRRAHAAVAVHAADGDGHCRVRLYLLLANRIRTGD